MFSEEKTIETFAKVTPCVYINMSEISSMCVIPSDLPDNAIGGRINIVMKNGLTFETFFKTFDEVFQSLGMTITKT